MAGSSITRRQFNKWLAAALVAGGARAPAHAAARIPTPLRVAAIQMVPRLGDVSSNLNQAEQLVRQALRQGARWIILPEFFASAMAFHPDMLRTIQPLDGAPLRLLKALSREGNAVIGGSFLAERGGQHLCPGFPGRIVRTARQGFTDLLGELLLPGRHR